ncbi:hypothetical protein BDV41DRAFT_305801 [Aspergillus transmontanensis]|uniref:Uncharacterized protein n=1 Tax=Aspergillus transmontanensis TaxID=1034304 RepID=A0A5N6VUN8_9EURO|nr:hypothetical protein BDV41DRAFT_305801 [Aspergillus transmontanensis]
MRPRRPQSQLSTLTNLECYLLLVLGCHTILFTCYPGFDVCRDLHCICRFLIISSPLSPISKNASYSYTLVC